MKTEQPRQSSIVDLTNIVVHEAFRIAWERHVKDEMLEQAIFTAP